MTISIAHQSQASPRSGRTSNQSSEVKEPDKKPKKINSEIRKQQNRIASRNYREKRKRKLQHLEQLIKDVNSSDYPASEASFRSFDNHVRLSSEEYDIARRSLSPAALPSNDDFELAAPSNTGEFDTTLAASTTSIGRNPMATTQSYPTVEQPWNVSWWTSNMDPLPRVTSSSQLFDYKPTSNQAVYYTITTPSQQPHQFFLPPDSESYTPNLSYWIYNKPPQ